MGDNTLGRWLRGPLGIGTLVVGLFAGAVVFGLNATNGMPLAERREVKVEFADLSGLNRGDDVRIAGSRVGYVDRMALEDGRAIAVLKLDDPDTEVYANSTARVSDRSGLGQKYVNLDPGDDTAPQLAESEVIPAERTMRSEDINVLLDVFDEKTRDQASKALRNLGGGMIGHGEDAHAFLRKAPEIVRSTGKVAGALAADRGEPLEAMLESADQLSARFAGRQDELAALIDEFGTTIDSLAVDDGAAVDASLDQAPDTLDAARGALQSLDRPLADLAVATRQLRPGASALGAATPDLRAFLRDGVGPVGKVPSVNKAAEPGVKAIDDLVIDARPLARQLVSTGRSGAPLGGVLGAYAGDISHYYSAAVGSLAQGDSAGNWLRIMLLPSAEVVGLPVAVNRDPYPAPRN
ncbi:MlaD family protein [Nocardioides daejeonensis]|uniref:MlaD family protein n=1 Tax=Nocardioides daejeonensis TaxID=1046556 RepID=UPI000D742D2E|nr:MlaD family protein [Nocardioides daejeonensis]